MSDKHEERSSKADHHSHHHRKTSSIQTNHKDLNMDENEHSLEEIERELDELRPKPPSPKTKHRIEEEEKKKDREIAEEKVRKLSTTSLHTSDDNERHHHYNYHHEQQQANELIPGQPDPTVNNNVKIPILNDRGDIELKPQQGSVYHINHENFSSNNQSTINK